MTQHMSAANIIRELERDITRNQPTDPLQYCANWCNSKLEEQRNAALGGEWNAAHPTLAGSNYTFGGTLPSALQGRRNFAHEAFPNYWQSKEGISPSQSMAGATNNNNNGSPTSGVAPTSSSSSTITPGQPPINMNIDNNTNTSTNNNPNNDNNNMMTDNDNTNASTSTNTNTTSPLGIPLAYNLARRTSVSAESLDPSKFAEFRQVERIEKDASQIERIERAINDNFLFRNLDQEQHDDVLAVMKEVKVSKGTDVIHQGAIGDYFYVVEKGTFDIFVKPQATHSYDPVSRMTTTKESTDPPKRVAQIGAGGSFGELALMYNAPRAATVTATSDAVLWAIDRITFRSILMAHTVRKRRTYETLLSEVEILRSLHPHERAKVADSLESRTFEPGEDVVREGEIGKDFYIIESGEAEVLLRDPEGQGHAVNHLKKGDYFGEIALMNNSKRQATVRATTKLCVASLGEKAFTRLLGPIKEILKRNAGSYSTLSSSSTSASANSSVSSPPPTKVARPISPTEASQS